MEAFQEKKQGERVETLTNVCKNKKVLEISRPILMVHVLVIES